MLLSLKKKTFLSESIVDGTRGIESSVDEVVFKLWIKTMTRILKSILSLDLD